MPITNKAYIHIHIQVFVQTYALFSLGKIAKGEMAGWVLNFSHSSECVLAYHCSFNLSFTNG